MACLVFRRTHILSGFWCYPSILQSLWHHLCSQDAIMATAVANWLISKVAESPHNYSYPIQTTVSSFAEGLATADKKDLKYIPDPYPYFISHTQTTWPTHSDKYVNISDFHGAAELFLAIPRFVLIKLLKRRMLDLNGWWYNKWICPVAFSCSVPRPINIETYFSQPADYTNTARKHKHRHKHKYRHKHKHSAP